ncbi:MAG: rRNA maturation RNase YbeY [Oleiphilaceae bacterium]|nr:rRNA maturation RNase YbeY [Oleiphilaceae bacterium]
MNTEPSPATGALTVDIQIACEEPLVPPRAQLSLWARTGYLCEQPVEVTLRLVSPEESADLNHRYRGKDRPTNVLSFPFEAPPGMTLPLLGDLVICADVVAREALAQSKPLAAHWAHMVIHGMLHLQGHDHEEPDQADAMEALEVRLLQTLGLPDPYLSDDTGNGDSPSLSNPDNRKERESPHE